MDAKSYLKLEGGMNKARNPCGAVRVEHSGVFGVHEHRVEVRDVRNGVRILGESRRSLDQLRGTG
jgi:hypothetical protein